MKKILVINTVGFKTAGMSVVIMNYFQYMDKKKFHMDFVVNNYIEPGYKKILCGEGSEIFILDRNKVFGYFRRLIKIIKDNKYDIVHVHGNSCTVAIELLAAKLAGCKRRIAHSHSSSCDHKIAHRILRLFFECCCTDRLACSESAGNWLFKDKKYTVIHDAMKLSQYRFDAGKRKKIRQQIQVDEDCTLLGHIGRFNEPKNQIFLIHILECLLKDQRNYRLLLVGDGDLKEEIKDYVEKNKLDDYVLFWGVTDDVAGVLSAMDLFVFPSRFEGLGIVMIEAQLTGLPCIASDTVPIDTEISRYCRYLGLEQPLEDWCRQIQDMESRKTDRENQIVDSLKIEKYDIEKQITVLENMYMCF